MHLILSSRSTEENSLEQEHQEVATLNAGREPNVNVDELPALHHLIRLDWSETYKQKYEEARTG